MFRTFAQRGARERSVTAWVRVPPEKLLFSSVPAAAGGKEDFATAWERMESLLELLRNPKLHRKHHLTLIPVYGYPEIGERRSHSLLLLLSL